jgi:hypothetical protein
MEGIPPLEINTSQTSQESLAFYKRQNFIPLHTTARYQAVFCARWIQTTLFHLISLERF